MKRINTVALVTIAGAIIFLGCSKKDSPKTNPITTSYKMTANVNADLFNTDSCIFTPDYADPHQTSDSSYTIQGIVLTKTGNIPAYSRIDLNLFRYRGVGTYDIYNPVGNLPYFGPGYYTDTVNYYFLPSGSVDVISVSQTAISGTFHFNAIPDIGSDSVVVTNGTFTAQVK